MSAQHHGPDRLERERPACRDDHHPIGQIRRVAHGLATVRVREGERRRRSVYTITTKGRRAPKAWLASQPIAPDVHESQAMIRVGFSEKGSTTDLLDALAQMRRQSEEILFDIAAREYLSTGGYFRIGFTSSRCGNGICSNTRRRGRVPEGSREANDARLAKVSSHEGRGPGRSSRRSSDLGVTRLLRSPSRSALM